MDPWTEAERLTARETDREETERENRAEERERKTELTIIQKRGAESEEGERNKCVTGIWKVSH